MKYRVSSLACAVITLALSLTAPLAHAGAGTDVMKARQTALREIWTKQPVDQRKIDAGIDQLLDYPAMTEASLGSEWARRSAEEKQECALLFRRLVHNDYERLGKRTLASRIEYLGDESTAGGIIVKTKATPTTPREEPVNITFILAQRDATWKVQDIITEGVSLVGSYRSQFTKIVMKDGFKVLITKMKDKLAQGV